MNRNTTYHNNHCDDNYKDVLSALSELDEQADIDYVQENYKCEYASASQRCCMELHPLQHAAKLIHYLIRKNCA